jgi:hypothetical protein
MELKQWFKRGMFNRVVLLVWIISWVFVVYSLFQIDDIVNRSLYGYGLTFSDNWAIPYWTYLRLIFVSLSIPAALTGLAFIGDYVSHKHRMLSVHATINNKPVTSKENAVSTLTITCPKCNKVFTRPLSMLDFSTGKAQLVNVCPYCNYVLGGIEESSDSIRIADLTEEGVAQKNSR